MDKEKINVSIPDIEIKTGAHGIISSNAAIDSVTSLNLRNKYWSEIPDYQRNSELLEKRWIALWHKLSEYLTEAELKKIGEAFVFAANAHGKQIRYTGEPYIVHPITVALILAGMAMDNDALSAAIMHDVLEDTPTTSEEVEKQFGSTVVTLIDGVTKLGKLPFKSVEYYQSENLRKMFVVMAKDIRVVLIKLADRLHNMRTLTVHRHDKQVRIARETLEIYAPLAH